MAYCNNCGASLTGQQVRYCSARCRVAYRRPTRTSRFTREVAKAQQEERTLYTHLLARMCRITPTCAAHRLTKAGWTVTAPGIYIYLRKHYEDHT